MQTSLFTGMPECYVASHRPDVPILFFNPVKLRNRLDLFRKGFPGLVTYAVKANDTPEVVENLSMAGLRTFDVASPAEIMRVRGLCPDATLHYNNPVRSTCEIQAGIQAGIASWSVDCISELEKLIENRVAGEIAVRLHLPIGGSAYNFGEKFGACPDAAVKLLQRVAMAGYPTAMTFHVGTQCTDYSAWEEYISACCDIALRANVSLTHVNVGGGFPAHRNSSVPDLSSLFGRILEAVNSTFCAKVPLLVCEPGRSMVSECYQLLVRVKGRKIGNILYLNDGIYGTLAEWRDIGPIKRLDVICPSGDAITSPRTDFTVFGPTCDSLDRLPGFVSLPRTIKDGDYILISGMGAYSNVTCTSFNGYGKVERVTITPL